jgi:hypothetical protein
MNDLAHLPVSNWPTLQIYAAFKQYWHASIQFMKASTLPGPPVRHVEAYSYWQKVHDEAFPALIELLRCARKL